MSELASTKKPKNILLQLWTWDILLQNTQITILPNFEFHGIFGEISLSFSPPFGGIPNQPKAGLEWSLSNASRKDANPLLAGKLQAWTKGKLKILFSTLWL